MPGSVTAPEAAGFASFASPVPEPSRRITVSQGLDRSPLAQVGRITILQPHDGDRFVLVPDQENVTRFRAVPEEPLPEIIWLLNGRELARTPPPYEFFWTMEKGRHEIAAIGPGEQGSSIMIEVE